MSEIHFVNSVVQIGSVLLVTLPKDQSVKLPSRGIVSVKGHINGKEIRSVLEPDGKGSHWMRLDNSFQAGDEIDITLESSQEWPEPHIPADIKKAFESDGYAWESWKSITPLARWDWLRWIGATKKPETRQLRIEKTISKFKSGKRSPCCFNRSECTDPSVSEKGVLIEFRKV